MKKLETFFKEKELEPVSWELMDSREMWHLISNDVVIEFILEQPEEFQRRIYKKIVPLDFVNADINDFLKHIAEYMVEMVPF